MMYRPILLVFSLFFAINLCAKNLKTNVKVDYDIDQNESIKKSVQNYLSRYLGKGASEESTLATENFPKKMYFASQVSCSFTDINSSFFAINLCAKNLKTNVKVDYDIDQNESIKKSVENYLSRYVGKDASEESTLATENFAINLCAKNLINNVKVDYDIDQNESVKKSVENYLSRYVGKDASEESRLAAENFLKTMYFISQVSCNFIDITSSAQLACHIKSKKIIRDIKIIGLPSALLESELKRKLPVQLGLAVDHDETFLEMLQGTKTRVETFLKKSGYYGASVVVTEKTTNQSLLLDIIITINPGIFARVHEVSVYGDVPIRKRVISNQYKRMCLSFNKIVESISIGTLSCYSRELERDVTQSLQEKFAKMGYVQSRIRISHHWVDANDTSAPEDCRKNNATLPASRCVNLRVDIDKGPKVSWSINIKDRISVGRNAFLRFLSAMFSVDLLSRASLPDDSDEQALDHVIVRQDLQKQITFLAARNVDEQEMSQSAKAIADYLIAQGYYNAEVVPSFIQPDPENLVVNFDVFAGKPRFISSVKILPEKYMDFIGEEVIESRLKSRGVLDNGYLSSKDVSDTKEEIINKLKGKGFSNVAISTDMESLETGEVNIVFYVTSDERKTIDQIIIQNGINEIDEKLAPILYNCDNYVYPKRRNNVRKLCQNSSFVLDRLDDDVSRLADFYQTYGYLYTKAKVEFHEDKQKVNLIFTVYDQRFGDSPLVALKRQDIKDIIVSGNISTRESVIKRLFPKERKSSRLDPIALQKGLANLRESGRFSRIDDRKIMAGEENSDDVYFLLHVTERPSLSLDTSISFSTDQLFMLETELEESNFLSSMLKLNTSLGLGLFWGRQTIFNNKLIWPTMFGKPVRFTLTAPTIVYDDQLHRPVPRRIVRSEVSFWFEWNVTSSLTPYLKYRLFLKQAEKFNADNIPKPSFDERLKSLDGLIPTLQAAGSVRGVLRPGLWYIDLDNPYNPRFGIDTNWWTEFSGGPFVGTPPYVNLGTQNRFFIPLGPLTFAFQATFMRAFIKPSTENWEDLRDSSSMDNLGGDRSVRGYGDGTIGITELDSPTGEYAGYFSNVANFEIRFPLSPKGNLGNFSGAVFVDQAMLLPCDSLFSCMPGSKQGFGLSVGAALRYALPVGPISVDYGISPITGNGRFHLLFGYAF